MTEQDEKLMQQRWLRVWKPIFKGMFWVVIVVAIVEIWKELWVPSVSFVAVIVLVLLGLVVSKY